MLSQPLINNSSKRVLETQLATSEQVSLIKLEDTVSNPNLPLYLIIHLLPLTSSTSHQSPLSFSEPLSLLLS